MNTGEHREEILITANDVARLLKVSPSTVRMWVAQDAIPFIRLGRLVRFRREEIEGWLAARSRQSGEAPRKAQ